MSQLRPPTIIETARLRLRPPVLDDAEAIFARYASDPQVTRYLIWSAHETAEMTRGFLQRCLAVWEDGSAFPWVIEGRQDGQLIGMIELRIEGHSADLGYVLARPCWGQGFATETTRAIVTWALAQPAIYRVWAVCDVENAASAHVLEKAGMQREGCLRRWMLRPDLSDIPRDCWCYSVVK